MPFRFFDLPYNVRRQIYCALPLQIKHRDVDYEGRVCLTLIMRGLPLAILRTCKKVIGEAKEILHERMRREITRAPLRVILRSEWDTSLESRRNRYLVLSALAHAIEGAKTRIREGERLQERILQDAEDKWYLAYMSKNTTLTYTCTCLRNALRTTQQTKPLQDALLLLSTNTVPSYLIEVCPPSCSLYITKSTHPSGFLHSRLRHERDAFVGRAFRWWLCAKGQHDVLEQRCRL
jgi:hypothetical protein